MKRSFLIMCFSLGLTACGNPSVEELVADVDLLNDALEECSEMSRNDADDSELCSRAEKAMVQVSQEAAADMLKSLFGR